MEERVTDASVDAEAEMKASSCCCCFSAAANASAAVLPPLDSRRNIG